MTNKFIAPVIVTVCIILYYSGVGVVLWKFDLPLFLKIAGVLFSVFITALIIKVLVERIREIRSGKEDDLGKY